ncbi:hypothetical protein [Aeromonas veronii]|uniref:hypothetical protein n=1 Tax=Aeromonas veronii TaxID=654 RepID=UPI003B9E7FBE
MSLTPEQIQKNIDTYNRLNPPCPERDAQEAWINAMYEWMQHSADDYAKAGEDMMKLALEHINGKLPTHYKK